jgi:mRNA-degrading endonuclease YafQ of YafQ-DinJ toxin-antitoxin module
MRTIERTTIFKRDLKRESKGRHRTYLSENFVAVVQSLADDQPLADTFHDLHCRATGRVTVIATSNRPGAYLSKA